MSGIDLPQELLSDDVVEEIYNEDLSTVEDENSPSTDDDGDLPAKLPLVTVEPKPLNKVVSILMTCTINMIFPFINGMMLGFGEIFAHELGHKYGWFGARIYQPTIRKNRDNEVVVHE